MIYRIVAPRRRVVAGMPKATSGTVTCGFRWRSVGRIWHGTLDSVSGKTKPQKPVGKRQADGSLAATSAMVYCADGRDRGPRRRSIVLN